MLRGKRNDMRYSGGVVSSTVIAAIGTQHTRQRHKKSAVRRNKLHTTTRMLRDQRNDMRNSSGTVS